MLNNRYKSIIIFILVCLINAYIQKDIDFQFVFVMSLLCLLSIKLYSKDKIIESYQQLEILIPLYNDLNINKKIPFTRGYAASPDFLSLIRDIIKENKPKLILEAGSGVSTIISAYSVKKYKEGKIISLDHEKTYSELTKQTIIDHELENNVKVVYAPLIKYENYYWYDIKKIPEFDKIDLFIIDGPPINSSKNARYPAIPLLFDKIKKGTIILLDDAKRKEEQQIVSLWKKQYNDFDFKFIKNSKGAYIIKKI